MVKKIVSAMLRRAGYQIVRLPRQQVRRSVLADGLKRRFASKIAGDPLNSSLHLQYAIEASKIGLPYLAYAELKTAVCLGIGPEEAQTHENAFRVALPKLEYMNHNQYFRFRSLASEIISRGGNTNLSVVDVGGGEGQLASFIPAVNYFLSEPTVNGISGTALPFADRSFDYVVSCHVLEHIPANGRTSFLDQLLSKAKRGLILLNPFHVEGSYVDERLRLVIDITGARWAEEHLDCALPTLDDIRSFAEKRGLQLSVKPNGTLTTSLSFVFTDHFAAQSGLYHDLEKVNAFFNEKYAGILDSAAYPNAYLIYLGRQ